MSRTSLGQRNDQLKRQLGSKVKQVTSVVRSQEKGPEKFFSLQDQEANLFRFLRDKYQRTERDTQYISCQLGECYSNIKDDFGKHIFENGDEYIGEWKNQKMQGTGKYTFQNPKKYYLGQFANGYFHGYGILAESQGNSATYIYQGEWEKCQKHGQGTHFYQNGQVWYTGDWRNNKKEGFGTVNLPTGQYVGRWREDQRQGEGKLTKQERGVTLTYQGDWDNDELHEGTIQYFQNDYYNASKNVSLGKYKGHLQNGKKHGWGHYYWPTNNHSRSQAIEYDGMFYDDRIRGRGKIIIGNFKFEGEFYAQDDTFGGPEIKGLISYENGDKFEGIVSIRDGKVRREKGTYHFENGDRADGQFMDNEEGQMKGKFLYEWSNGQSKQFS